MTYYECPACQWGCVLNLHTDAPLGCPLCLEDNGRFVRLEGRPATASDKPEGPDERLILSVDPAIEGAFVMLDPATGKFVTRM
jgi:hypothetical protein